MSTKRVDLNAIIPITLDTKLQSRRDTHLVAGAGDEAYLVATYNDAGSYVLYSLVNKKLHKINRKNPLKAIRTSFPFVVSLHEKGKLTNVEVYDIITHRSIGLRWPGTDEMMSVAVPSKDGIIAVGKSHIYRSAGVSDKEMSKIAVVGGELATGLISKGCTVRDKHLLLVASRQVQLWHIETGVLEKDIKPKQANSTFLLTAFDEGYIVVTTATDFTISRVGSPSSITVTTKITVSSTHIEGDTLYIGDLDGTVTAYALATGKLLQHINKPEVATGSRSLMTQMRSRVNIIRIYEEFLFCVLDTGDVAIYLKDAPEQLEPVKVINTRGKVSSILRSEKNIYMHVVKRDKKTEELFTWPLSNFKKIRFLLRLSSQRRLQGTTEADYEKEIVKTGYLSIKSLSDKNQSAKGKKRYTVLRNNGIVYAYRSPQDSAPTETYMLKNKSIVKIVKGKVGTLTITISPAVQLRFTADGQADAESWLEAISTTIKEMGLAEVWEIDSNEIKFEKSLTGDSVTVGKGASSTVMKGTYNGKPVAVKYYKQKDLNIEEFKNEVLLLHAVKHPSILPIYGITKSRDGTPAIVMPYVEKGTLFDVLHNGKLDSATYDWKLYLKIASDVARALEYLHTFKMNGVKQPIIHSDLKTANLLINNLSAKTAQSSVMLIDFGISVQKASILDPDNTKRQGTIGYMSPELIRGSGKYTAKIDAYAFGTLLWEMLTMKIPYHKMSSKQIETLVLKGERPAIPPSTPQELTDLIESCWKASPEDRPTFSQILEKILLFGATITVDDLSDTSVLSDMSPRNRSTTTSNGSRTVSHKLYGRKKEMIKLLKVVSEFGMGGNSVVMIKGKSGTGKSELLSRFAKFAAFEGFIMEGRFSKDDKTPYSAIRAGLRTQFQCALKAWTNEERLAVTNKLLYTFDETGLDIICNMVPEMAVLVGRDGEFQRADISADKFNTTLTKLFRRMSSQDHPLIIMLDDLQWADQASLGLLAKLSQDLDKDTDTRLLIVGAYRDSDVDERHPLQTVLLNKLSIDTLTQITVKPLDQAEVTELIQDSFPSFEPRKVESLASAIYERTLGVPFMVNQFLQSLSSDSALVTRQGSTVHDELIQNIKQTDNILVSNLNALKSDLYSILTLGSYFSTEFNTTIMSNVLKTLQLSVANGTVKVTQINRSSSAPATSKREVIESNLEEAIQKGIVVSKGKHIFAFQQERIREALQSSISTDAGQQLVHLELARAMALQLKSSKKAAEQMDIFEAVHHYTCARQAITAKDELLELAQLYARAADTALSVGDFSEAFQHARAAVDVLDPFRAKTMEAELEQQVWNAWNTAAWANQWGANDVEFAHEAVKTLGTMANTPLRRALVGRAKIGVSFITLSNFQEAVQGFLDAVEVVGIKTDKMTAEELMTNPNADREIAREMQMRTGRNPEVFTSREKVKKVSDEIQTIVSIFSVGMNLTHMIGISQVSGYFALTWCKYILDDPKVPMNAEPLFQLANRIINSGPLVQCGDADPKVTAKRVWELSYTIWKSTKTAPLRAHTFNHFVESYFPRVKSWKSVRKLAAKGIKTSAEEGADAWAEYSAQTTYATTALFTSPLDDFLAGWTSVKIKSDSPQMSMQGKIMANMWTAPYRRIRGDAIPMLTDDQETMKNPIFAYAMRAMDAGYYALTGAYEESLELLEAIFANGLRPKHGDFPTILVEISTALTMLWKLRTEQDATKRKHYTEQYEASARLIESQELGSGNWAPFTRLFDAEQLYSDTAYNVLVEEQEMSEAVMVTIILKFNEAMKLADKQKGGIYNWVSGYAAERCAELAAQSGFEVMATFNALEAIRKYDAWGARLLVNKVRTYHASRISSSSSGSPRDSGSLTPTSSGTLTPSASFNHHHHHRLNLNGNHGSTETEALSHLALARTYSRALARQYKQLNEELPADHAEKGKYFYKEIHNLFNYLNAQSLLDDLMPEESATESDSGSHSVSVSESDTDEFKPANLPLIDIIEETAASVSFGLLSSDSPVATFVPPTEMPSVIANGSSLQQLLQHVLMSFITYHRGEQVSLVVRGEKTSSSTHVLRFQITNFAPENLDSLLVIPHAANLPANLAVNLKHVDPQLEMFQGEIFFHHTDKRTVMQLTVGVMAVHQVAVSIQNPLMADIVKRYLAAWGYEFAVMTGREVIAHASTLKLVIMDTLESSIDILRQFRSRGGNAACVVSIGGKPPSSIADAAASLVSRFVVPANVKTELHKIVISTLSIV